MAATKMLYVMDGEAAEAVRDRSRILQVVFDDRSLEVIQGGFRVSFAGDQVGILGQLRHPQEVSTMLKYLAVRKIISIIASTAVKADFPGLEHRPEFDGISGVLVVPLYLGSNEFMVFFRDAKLTREVIWAGNPYVSSTQLGSKGTRRSFGLWTEVTTQVGEEWFEDEIETATVLCLLSQKAQRVPKLGASQLQGDAIAQLLLKFLAHELRTPLNAIINYLGTARNDTLGAEIRGHLDRSYAASRSLTRAIDDMLTIHIDGGRTEHTVE